jgi:hypothetical protein
MTDELTGATRRELLGWSAVALAGSSLAGCDVLSTRPEGGATGKGRPAESEKEAPELAAQVKSGDLPLLPSVCRMSHSLLSLLMVSGSTVER